MTKKQIPFRTRFARKKGGKGFIFSDFTRKMNPFPPFSHGEASEKTLSFLSCT